MLSEPQGLLWVLPPRQDALVLGPRRAGAQGSTIGGEGRGGGDGRSRWATPQIRAQGGPMGRLFSRKSSFGEGQDFQGSSSYAKPER
jgi:hypothetical protein